MEGVTWLEVLDGRGAVVTRVRLERLPFVIGRGYAGDLVLDDPQLSATHVRIVADPDGTLVAEDLGTVNGTWSAAGVRIQRATVGSGDSLRAGRMTLRFLGPDHPVGPAEPAEAAPRLPLVRPAGARAAAGLAAAATAAVTVAAYFGSYARTDPGTQIAEAAGYALLIAAYAGIWSFIGRVTVHRFSFSRHLAIASAGVLAFTGLALLSQYLVFIAPDNAAVDVLAGLLMVALGAALLYWHLEVATAFGAAARATVAGAVVGGIVLLIVAGQWEEEFSPYPDFSAVVKPVAVGLTRRTTAAEFVAGAEALAAEVDSLALGPVR